MEGLGVGVGPVLLADYGVVVICKRRQWLSKQAGAEQEQEQEHEEHEERTAVHPMPVVQVAEIVILFGLARRTARQIEKVSLFYQR